MVARAGIEPPTPAFSGLYSITLGMMDTFALRRIFLILIGCLLKPFWNQYFQFTILEIDASF